MADNTQINSTQASILMALILSGTWLPNLTRRLLRNSRFSNVGKMIKFSIISGLMHSNSSKISGMIYLQILSIGRQDGDFMQLPTHFGEMTERSTYPVSTVYLVDLSFVDTLHIHWSLIRKMFFSWNDYPRSFRIITASIQLGWWQSFHFQI